MTNVRFVQFSFNGGEVTPEFFGKLDDQRYSSSAAKLRNFVATPHGPARNRPGTRVVNEVKDSSKKTRLIRFVFSNDQVFALEMGEGYFRFHVDGATLLNPDTREPYEVETPYMEADLFDIHYVQSKDIITLVHPKHPPKELRRYGAYDWKLEEIDFGPPLLPPTDVTVEKAGQTETKYTYEYVVTSLTEDLLGESEKSEMVSVEGNLYQTGSKNTISWQAVEGAARYNVYKKSGGLYGYIGQTDSLSIVDDDITPDVAITPPIYENEFSSENNYPAAVSYFEQRRVFAGTTNKPQNFWMTKSGTESSLVKSIPVKDDDRIAYRLAASESNIIRHVVPLTNMILLTSSTEFRVMPIDSDALTPSQITAKPQSDVGANNVQPLKVNTNLIFAAARGGHVRELSYNYQANGYVPGDVSLRAPHLFDGMEITDMAFQKAPYPICWFVNNVGELIGLTYVPEQQVGAWHKHDTDGVIESVCVVPEGIEDSVYLIVRREINGQTKRFVELMGDFLFGKLEDAFFVDCGLSYEGEPITAVSGLDHLEGKTVSILADGAVEPQQVVVDGRVEISSPARKIHIGLPYESDLETLPVTLQIDGYGQGRMKNVSRSWVRVHDSSGLFVGPDFESLVEAKQRSTEPYGSPPRLMSGEIELYLKPKWDGSGQIAIRQQHPLPLTVVSVTLEVAVGG